MAQSLAIDIYVCVGVTFLMASVLTGFRFWARRMTKIKLWWDDWFAALAYVTCVGWSAVVIAWTAGSGLGQKLDTLTISADEAIRRALIYTFVVELLYAFSLVFSKYAILGFYWRLFKTSAIRLPIQILVGLSTCWIIIRTFMTIFHCVPTQAFWTVSMQADAECNIDNSNFFFGTTLTHLLLDVAILVLPIVQVKNLKLRKGQKLGVIGLFMFGLVVCIAAIVLITFSKTSFSSSSKELPYDLNYIMIPATVEVNLSVVSACLPMMRPIVQKFMHGSPFASDGPSSGGGTSGGVGGTGTGVKLRTLTKAIELDDNSSTQNFADGNYRGETWADVETASSGSAEEGPRVSDAAADASGGNYPQRRPQHGSRTVIKTTAHGPDASQYAPPDRGIHIKNEMSVSYENA